MAQTAAEALIEQGARQMSIESTLLILTERFPRRRGPYRTATLGSHYGSQPAQTGEPYCFDC